MNNPYDVQRTAKLISIGWFLITSAAIFAKNGTVSLQKHIDKAEEIREIVVGMLEELENGA